MEESEKDPEQLIVRVGKQLAVSKKWPSKDAVIKLLKNHRKNAESEKEMDPKQVIILVGKQLAASKKWPSKDALIEILKQSTSALPELKQSELLKSVVKLLSDSLIRHGLLHSEDKDVSLLVSICLCEIIRVLAPNPDFSETVIRDVFGLFLRMFSELGAVKSPYFLWRAELLKIVVKLKFCLLMLDTGCDDLVLKMFKILFSVVRGDHDPSLISSMSSIITCILEEKLNELDSDVLFLGGNTLQQLLDVVLQNLIKEKKTDQVDVLMKALNLIKKLLRSCGKKITYEYPRLFTELLNRISDKSAEVRITALSCAKAYCMINHSGRESSECLSAIRGRLLDHDEKVRTVAVNAVCEQAKTNFNFASPDLISLAADKLHDKKVVVRSNALKGLVELYQVYCTSHAVHFSSLGVEEYIEEIPCKSLLLCYEKDCQDFRPQNMELKLADLFPASLSVEERTRHWIYIFSIFTPPHFKALRVIQSEKRRLRDGLQDYLTLRNRTEVFSGTQDVSRLDDPWIVNLWIQLELKPINEGSSGQSTTCERPPEAVHFYMLSFLQSRTILQFRRELSLYYKVELSTDQFMRNHKLNHPTDEGKIILIGVDTPDHHDTSLHLLGYPLKYEVNLQTLENPSNSLKILGAAIGLVLIKDRTSGIILLNPLLDTFTRVELPQPFEWNDEETVGFFYDESADDLKIAHLGASFVRLFSLKKKEWESVPFVFPKGLVIHLSDFPAFPAWVNGKLHSVCSCLEDRVDPETGIVSHLKDSMLILALRMENGVICFDFVTPPPAPCNGGWKNSFMEAYAVNGKLCLVPTKVQGTGVIRGWILEDYYNPSSWKCLTFCHGKMNDVGEACSQIRPLCLGQERDEVISLDRDMGMLVSYRNSTRVQVLMSIPDNWIIDGACYFETLVPVEEKKKGQVLIMSSGGTKALEDD